MVDNAQDVPFWGAITRGDVLAALNELAAVEHALCVEYLEVSYVLGHGALDEAPGPFGAKIAEAAETVFGMALGEMSHLRKVNRVLTLAGEPPQLDKAAAIDHGLGSGSATMFGPLNEAELRGLVEREANLAATVDARYALLSPALDPDSHRFEGEVLDQLAVVLASCSNHSDGAAELAGRLSELKSSEYLRVTRHAPVEAVERTLLELSRDHYKLVLAMLGASFTHDDELGGRLLNQAVTAMGVMDGLHALMVQRGLLPAISQPSRPE